MRGDYLNDRPTQEAPLDARKMFNEPSNDERPIFDNMAELRRWRERERRYREIADYEREY